MASALQVAGAYGLTFLYGLLPPLMAWQLRQRQQRAARTAGAAARGMGGQGLPAHGGCSAEGPLVPGGAPVLAAILVVVGAITVGRIASDLGLPLDQVAAHLAQAAVGQ